MTEPVRAGYAAIIGRPNVGKSTLLNRLLGQKISITSPKPQTTRHRILGIKTSAAGQILFVDTPGLHQQVKHAMNRYMHRVISSVLEDIDVVVLVADASRWTVADERVLERIQATQRPIILALNKVDQLPDKRTLLPLMDALSRKGDFAHIVPLSALQGDNVEVLERAVLALLPPAEPFFPPDQITDRSERFLAAELLREKLMRQLGEEIPYALTVEIEQFTEEAALLRIAAVIWVERRGQKAIVIGKHGAMLKLAGQQAREEMEELFQRKVFLQLWVKVRAGWSDDERALRSLGYDEV
jgi:GTP-binding protein Era